MNSYVSRKQKNGLGGDFYSFLTVNVTPSVRPKDDTSSVLAQLGYKMSKPYNISEPELEPRPEAEELSDNSDCSLRPAFRDFRDAPEDRMSPSMLRLLQIFTRHAANADQKSDTATSTPPMTSSCFEEESDDELARWTPGGSDDESSNNRDNWESSGSGHADWDDSTNCSSVSGTGYLNKMERTAFEDENPAPCTDDMEDDPMNRLLSMFKQVDADMEAAKFLKRQDVNRKAAEAAAASARKLSTEVRAEAAEHSDDATAPPTLNAAALAQITRIAILPPRKRPVSIVRKVSFESSD